MKRQLAALFAVLVCSGIAFGQSPPEPARIKIDTDRVIGEVHPHLFGNFAEHLGRCIYGGIYERGQPAVRRRRLSQGRDGGRPRPGRHPAALAGRQFRLRLQLEGRHRPARPAPGAPRGRLGRARAQHASAPTSSSLTARRSGVEPYICINAGLGTIEDARNWVEYTNESRDTYWAQQRRKNGRDKPYGVKYWGLGNEIDGPWQLGHKNAEDYTKFALEAAKAMRRVDASIKLIASGS